MLLVAKAICRLLQLMDLEINFVVIILQLFECLLILLENLLILSAICSLRQALAAKIGVCGLLVDNSQMMHW